MAACPACSAKLSPLFYYIHVPAGFYWLRCPQCKQKLKLSNGPFFLLLHVFAIGMFAVWELRSNWSFVSTGVLFLIGTMLAIECLFWRFPGAQVVVGDNVL